MADKGLKVITIKDQNAVVLEDGTVYKVQQKRQRRVLNCVPCHKRKVKCNRARPVCDHCEKNRYACAYFVNDRVSRGGQNKVPRESKQQLLRVIERARRAVEQGAAAGEAAGAERGGEPLERARNEDLRAALDRERHGELLEYYRVAVAPVLPLVDMEGYAQDADAFWATWDGEVDGERLDFLLLHLPLVYVALKARFHETNDAQLIEEVCMYHGLIRQLYELYDFPNKFTMRSLTGNVLLNSAVENPNITSVAQLARLAQRLQLTAAPESTLGSQEKVDVQFRRIIFWQIFQLDTLTSLHNRLPPLLRYSDCDTALPSEFDEGGKLNPNLCFLNAKYQFVILINDICQREAALHRGELSDKDLLEFRERVVQLHALCANKASLLSDYSRRCAIQAPATSFTCWAIFMLNTFADRAVLLQQNMLLRTIAQWKKQKKLESQLEQVPPNKYSDEFRIFHSIITDGGASIAAYLNKISKNSACNIMSMLFPATLHCLQEFVNYYTGKHHSTFNWLLLVGTLPMAAITFALKTLMVDLIHVHDSNGAMSLKTDLRFKLLYQVVTLIESKLNTNTTVYKHSLTLARLFLRLVLLKFGTSDDMERIPLNPDTANTDSQLPSPVPFLQQSSWSTSLFKLAPNHSMPHNSGSTVEQPLYAFSHNPRIVLGSPEQFRPLKRHIVSEHTGCNTDPQRVLQGMPVTPLSTMRHTPPISGYSLDSNKCDQRSIWHDFPTPLSADDALPPAESIDHASELSHIQAEVERYVMLVSASSAAGDDPNNIAPGDAYYQDFERTLLEVISTTLSMQ
ncbi:AaceriACL058Wp [[Ashbya] aceris (nom. inval.)]|nr:AaceriACL058Wp [[Ashbya] aceris (nom. inval.)]